MDQRKATNGRAAMADQAEVFTIGHTNHAIDQFLALLERHNIEAVADVRRFPGSRKYPHFNREQLSTSLAEHGLEYHWLESLGGRRKARIDASSSPNLGLRNESFRNYADYMLTEEFRQGVADLLKLARRKRTATLCAEGLFWQCHRRLVSDYLRANGMAVWHIFPNGDAKPHELTKEANVNAGQVTYPPPRSLFDEAGALES
jgi:uncharacterized protein (DUF488 family)